MSVKPSILRFKAFTHPPGRGGERMGKRNIFNLISYLMSYLNYFFLDGCTES